MYDGLDIKKAQEERKRNIFKNFNSVDLFEGEGNSNNLMNSISKAENDEFEKAFGISFEELEKARLAGDLFFSNGKTWVWTEYQPGKFCWHVVKNPKTNVTKGKGIKGKHGLNALKSVYGKDQTDVSKMLLRRTPNSHWRLHYDDVDTGITIDGDSITQSELQADNICYQAKKVVDTFDLLEDYLEFNSPDDVYFVQIIKRWKDNKDKPDADRWKADGKMKGSYHSGAEYLEYWLIHSYDELVSLKPQIIKSCSYNNARAYISINSRSKNQTNQYLSKFKGRFTANDPRAKNAEAILYGMAKSGPAWKNERLKVLLDIDTLRDNNVKLPNGKTVNIWDETKKRLKDNGIKVAAEYETPSGGLHLILNNKNNRNLAPFYKTLSDFDGGRNLDKLATVHPTEDIKMVLYSNVDTEGY